MSMLGQLAYAVDRSRKLIESDQEAERRKAWDEGEGGFGEGSDDDESDPSRRRPLPPPPAWTFNTRAAALASRKISQPGFGLGSIAIRGGRGDRRRAPQEAVQQV